MQLNDLKLRLVLFVSEDWFFLSHFADRARIAQQSGYECIVVARDNGLGVAIRKMGFTFEPLSIRRSSLSPLAAMKEVLELRSILTRTRPHIVHNVALKPIVLGTLVARALGLKRIVNAPVGMGYVYSSSAIRARLLRPLVKLILKVSLNPRGSKVIFENSDDLDELVANGSVSRKDARLIPGAGVDIEKFFWEPEPEGPVVVVLAARMLADKGVREFVEAARILKGKGLAARMVLVGAPDPENSAAIREGELQSWAREGVVEWHGHSSDVAAVLSTSHIACLPSYREGLPKFLLEAMASGKPIVTCDVTGCRHAVKDGVNGLLVPPRNSKALAEAIARLCRSAPLRQRMGLEGRKLAEDVFSIGHIAEQTLSVYHEFGLKGSSNPPNHSRPC